MTLLKVGRVENRVGDGGDMVENKTSKQNNEEKIATGHTRCPLIFLLQPSLLYLTFNGRMVNFFGLPG